jgi:hypothetical protein
MTEKNDAPTESDALEPSPEVWPSIERVCIPAGKDVGNTTVIEATPDPFA